MGAVSSGKKVTRDTSSIIHSLSRPLRVESAVLVHPKQLMADFGEHLEKKGGVAMSIDIRSGGKARIGWHAPVLLAASTFHQACYLP